MCPINSTIKLMKITYFNVVSLALLVCLHSSVVAVEPEDAEHVEIAKKFVERLFAHPDENLFEELQATEKMKEFFTPAAVKHWSNKIVNDYGKLDDCVNVEVVRHSQRSRSVFLFFQGEQRPVKMWVTFDDMLISGFHYDTWHEAAGIPEGVRIALLAVYVSVVLPVLMILIIYYGEKWRGRWLEARNRDLETFGVEQTAGTVYCES